MFSLNQYVNQIKNICGKHKVKHLYAFGSVLTDNFNENSDIDLIVDFEKIDLNEYADNYYDLKFSLEDLLHRPIDLLEQKAIKNPYFLEKIESQKQLVYAH